ncbi:hypothetical protein AB205_0156530 [Aquarana catesbeiana]|uniref:Uncharacterized protein n=2 Tax=Aquarana catesbeiana TaxID=8400 RepID=A0A2G9QC16_AQUCT|nr:hypothetical protein AB205_0156530 [Aquarana catesbeiana]
MSRRPLRRGRHSQATKRGQAASVSTVVVVDMVHPLQVAVGHACSFFAAAGCVIEPQHAEELVEWIMKPSSSSSSSDT